ncbi:Ubp5-interacting protein ftp105 [Sphaceloma murrayae]|uniref:Ubp5-interacting protein ftp105 n=1 Tax=Sphaceloma murrayae TaxID=2082308 RepID=A0A2K1QN88_9PEZI|nr:Ubp5-interacting protein ftp105 [Sphaceloma murrayae]
MGAVQSDLKASIVQATSGGRVIPKDDPFWQTYWLRPETAEHVFETFTTTDIRGMRDNATAAENLKTLILRTVLHLLKTRHQAVSLSDETGKHGLVALNCVRVLTRILPYIYEVDETRRWEESVFSAIQDESFFQGYAPDAIDYVQPHQPLIAQLTQTLLDLLFYTGFTLPWSEAETEPRKSQVSYSLWQSGIACDTTIVSSKEMESKRTEIMRLLITLESKSIYTIPPDYIDYNVDAVQYITRHADKRRVQSLLCSLLNTVIKYHPDSWLPFDPRNPQGDNVRETHIRVCLHFLLVNMLTRAPWDEAGKERNEFRLQFSYLHKPKHLQFLADGIFKILRRPLESNSNVLSMAQRPIPWTPEMIILLWEALFTNRKYLHYVVESGRALDLMVLLVYYAKESHMDGVGRVCVFCLQTLSAEKHFGELLNRPFEAHDTLPSSIQIKNFHGRYSDYFITSMLSLLEHTSPEATFWSVSLTSIITNVTPHVTGLGRATSSKLMQTFARLAKPSVVLASESNVNTLSNLLHAINLIIEHHDTGHENSNLLYATWRAREKFRSLRDLSLMDEEGMSQLEIPCSSRSSMEVPNDRVETEKSKGKRPSEYKTWSGGLMNKLADLPLHTSLTLISLLESNLGVSPDADDGISTPSVDSSARPSLTERRGSLDKADILRMVKELGKVPGLDRREVVEADKFAFQPSIAALYASYFWGLVVSHDAQRVSGTGTGIWAGTEIRLFRIKAGQIQGPSLWSPKGAVDAVGESLVAGVKDLTLRAKKGISGE